VEDGPYHAHACQRGEPGNERPALREHRVIQDDLLDERRQTQDDLSDYGKTATDPKRAAVQIGR
jgi:hypothetical protein